MGPTSLTSLPSRTGGYLDIADDAHIYFWFFESRNKPSKDPLVVWFVDSAAFPSFGELTSCSALRLNGGPGCSSSTGLLFELGPCSVANEGQNTTYNKYSWTESANMIFIDSPVSFMCPASSRKTRRLTCNDAPGQRRLQLRWQDGQLVARHCRGS